MYVTAYVIPGAKKESVRASGEDAFEISVREPARNNLANRRVIELIAREWGVQARDARIVSGHRSPKKLLSVLDANEH